ncbi:MAG TPA: hypothetical protein VFP72_05145 [Kineosporiaceae bacterium]|nr:hypothetical protein [Kineosporiaceae bacterium]
MELVQGPALELFGPGQTWELYRRSFPRRRRPGAGQQAMSRDEFVAVMADPRYSGLGLVERTAVDPLVGLAALTADPQAIPPAARRLVEPVWPEHLATGRLWFVRFLVVDPAYEDTTAATHLAGGIWTRAVADGGVVTVDTTAFNDTAVRLPSALFHLARSIAPRTTLRRVDDEGLWAYEFPEPVPV